MNSANPGRKASGVYFVRAIALLCALAAMWPVTALSCGPTRYKHGTTIEIDASAARVWDVVGNYADFSWTGRISATEAFGGLVPDVARRRLTFKSGAIFADQLTVHDPGQMTIAFMTDIEDVREIPVRNYASRITVRDSGGRAVVEWRGAFVRGYPNNDPPPELSDEAASAAVADFQQSALKHLKRTIESGQ